MASLEKTEGLGTQGPHFCTAPSCVGEQRLFSPARAWSAISPSPQLAWCGSRPTRPRQASELADSTAVLPKVGSWDPQNPHHSGA